MMHPRTPWDVSVFAKTCTCEEMVCDCTAVLPSVYEFSFPYRTTAVLTVPVPVAVLPWPRRTAVYPLRQHRAHVRVYDSTSPTYRILSTCPTPCATVRFG